jgi:hypothetical protein
VRLDHIFFLLTLLQMQILTGRSAISIIMVFNIDRFIGDLSEEATPVTISNTEVKLVSADGPAWETVWESRSPPFLIQKPR